MITGFNHYTIAVKDLERSFMFYRETLGLKPLIKWNEGAYFLAGQDWFCLNLDNNTRNSELPEYTHLAFSVSENDFSQLAQRLKEFNVKEFKENKSEGLSIYFLDPDGHKLELHLGDWKTRMEHYKKNPKDGMEFFI